MLTLNNPTTGLSAQPIGQRIKKLLGRSQPWSRGQKYFNQSAYDTVGAFMKKFAIDPSPENYALTFNFVVKKDASLLELIGELIKTGYARDDSRLPNITEQFETDLANLANNTHDQLAAIEGIISRSRGEVTEYGSALKDVSGDAPEPKQIDSATLLSLCDLTRVMISKTRAVETELRSRGKAIEGLIGSLREAKSKADTDILTGLSNRRAFERQLGAAFERARQSGGSCTLAICDIDHFKAINDSFGHQTGDKVIQHVADSLADNCRDQGHVFRFGGEEYVILFENVSFEQAFNCVKAAMEEMAGRNFIHLETKKPIGTVTFSCGLSTIGDATDPSALLGSADRALYQAKAAGRNCIKTIAAEQGG
jgi:diguanylate cyclase